jgi:hypothetical protein
LVMRQISKAPPKNGSMSCFLGSFLTDC